MRLLDLKDFSMNNRVSTISSDRRSFGVLEEMRSAFAERFGRDLTETEQSFVEHMFRDDSIAALSWGWTERFEEAVVTSEGIVGMPVSSFLAGGRPFVPAIKKCSGRKRH